MYDDHPKLARAQTRAYTRGLPSSASAYVAVVGPGEATPPELDAAREVGELLGARGAVLICGGLGGVMESASA